MDRVLATMGWLAVALLGAIALGIVALSRGEPINAVWLVGAALCVYLIAYRLYGLFIARSVLKLDPGTVDAGCALQRLVGQEAGRADLGALVRRCVQMARLMVGVPDYDTYVEHRRRIHPDEPIMSYKEFFRERQASRYGGAAATLGAAADRGIDGASVACIAAQVDLAEVLRRFSLGGGRHITNPVPQTRGRIHERKNHGSDP